MPRTSSVAKVEISPEFSYAIDAVKKGVSLLFVSGKAGTGKSTFIQLLRNKLKKQVAVVAPTGLAALGVQGQTIHSFFKIPPQNTLDRNLRPLKDPSVLQALQLLIIDEVSMVRADLLDTVDQVLRLNRNQLKRRFGGVQIVLIGDLFQLPPVVVDSERDNLAGRYATEFFFGADSVTGGPLEFIEFTKVYRQEDPQFTELLQNIREANEIDRTLRLINLYCVRDVNQTENPTILTFTNKEANKINDLELDRIKSKPHIYNACIEGNFDNQDSRLPAPIQLTLKKEARVIFTANDRDDRWANGSVGKVVSLGKDYARVSLQKGASTRTYRVEAHEWTRYEQIYDPKLKQIISEPVGSFWQLPLRPAWAVTVHKSQGMTLDCVRIEAKRKAFAPGQLYVALSRCRTWEGVSLSRPLSERDVIVSDAVREFYGRHRIK